MRITSIVLVTGIFLFSCYDNEKAEQNNERIPVEVISSGCLPVVDNSVSRKLSNGESIVFSADSAQVIINHNYHWEDCIIDFYSEYLINDNVIEIWEMPVLIDEGSLCGCPRNTKNIITDVKPGVYTVIFNCNYDYYDEVLTHTETAEVTVE